MFKPFSKRSQHGQNLDVYKYDVLPRTLKTQIIHVWDALILRFTNAQMEGTDQFYRALAQKVCEERGVFQLTKTAPTAQHDLSGYFLQETDVRKCLDVIELVFHVLIQYWRANSYIEVGVDNDIRQAIADLNSRFKEHSIGYEFRDGIIIRIDSDFIHTEATAPALTLLQAPHLAGANAEFLKAHEHFRHGRYQETINECLKSFESTMKGICHKRYWPYNQSDTAKVLIKICEDKGLFPVFMTNHITGLRTTLESGVPTARNKTSAHGQGVTPVSVSEDFAKYVLNLTATNILFLAAAEQKLA